MLINYWKCKYEDYNEFYNENDGETRIYGCTHPDGCGTCPLDNKFAGDEADCKLLDR